MHFVSNMQLKYLTLNVWLGGKVFAPLMEFIGQSNADIFSFQEVYDGAEASAEERFRTMQALRQVLPAHHHAFAPAMLDTAVTPATDLGNAIFSRWSITASDVTFFGPPYGKIPSNVENAPVAPRNMLHLTLDVAGTPVDIFNVHGIWREDGEDNAERLHMSQVIQKAVRGKSHAILSGDFNARQQTETMRGIGRVLTPVFGDELVTTFNMKYKKNPGFATAAVDMIFVGSGFRVLERTCHTEDVSDHRALSCLLEW